ncbi:MAG: fibronectin type III domain-containing protein, partial [Victivallaceae bacterium]
MLSSVISATGTLQLTSASSGGNTAQGGVNSTSIRNNVLTVAGILSNSITVGGAISTSITAYGSMGTKVTSGSINNANDPSAETGNRLNVYGIKTDSLVCSDFSGVITVNSRNTDSNPALRNSRVNSFITIQTVGLYVDQSINGGDPDTAMNISGVISVTAENGGVAAGIMGGFSGINITISGSIIVNAFGVDIDQNPVSGPAFAVYCGDYTQRSFNGLNGAAFENYVTKAIDDRVEITAGAQVVGDFQLSTGTNYVTIDSRASVIGDLMSMGGTLNLQFNLVGAALSNPILTANTDFASAQCSISTFTIDINEAESGRYQLMNDAGGVNYKWVGREVSLIYNGQTYVTTVGFEASAAISYLNGVDGFGFKVFLSTDNKTIIAEMVEASPNLSVGPGIGAPVIDLNSATLSWQDMSVAYDPANPVDPDSTIAGVAWDGRQVARYELEFSVSNDFSNAMSRYIYGDSTGYAATDIVISGLAVGDYFWRVRTLYADGTLSGWSDDAGPSATFTVVNKLFYTTPDVIDNTTMAAVDPNGAAGKFSNSVVKLDWADSTAATGINYYVVEYYSSTDKADYYISADQTGWDQWVADGGTVNTRMISASELILSGLGNYTNLHWRVKAVANDLGGNLDNVPTEGEWSYYQNPIVVWVGDKTAPTAASKLDVNAIVNADDPSKIDMELLWNVSNDAQSGVQRYIVQYGLSQDWSDPANYTELMVSGSAAQLTPDGKITIPGLGETLNNQCYYWRVQAVDYVGNSSSWVEGKTFIIDMTAPTDPVLIDVATSGTTSLGADGITFNWKPSEDASTLTYDIQISASGDFSSDFYAAAIGVDGVADTSGNLSFTISGADFATLLTNSGYSFADGVMFHWRVKAFDHPVGASYSNESNWVSGQFAVDLTDDTAPVGPTTISLSQVPGQRSISVTWTPAADNKTPQAELKYLVYYKAAGDTAWTQRVADTNSFTLTGVEEGKEYFFKVSAIDNASNVGAESAEASIICDATAPTNNAGLASLVTSGPNGSIVLSWNVATDAGDAAQSFNTNYELQYSTSYLFTPGAGLHTITVNSGNMVVANGRVTLTVSGAELAGFADLTTYFWRIQAVDHAGNKSAFSAGTDKFVAPDVTAPTEPANLTMVRVPNQQMTRFQWDASADNSRSVSYILSYWTNPDKSDIQSVTVTGTSKDLALAAGPVFWSVQAVDNVGNKSVATEAGGTVDYIAPYIPSARVAAVNQTTRAVTLSWTPANPDDAAPGSGLAKYEIRYSNTSAYNPDDTVTVTVDGALSEYVLGSNLLKDAETYYWQIRAIDHNGNASVWNDGAGAIFIAPDTTNATGDAKPISVGQTLNERIGGPKDPADYYYLSLGQTGNYTFTVTSNATTVGITLVNLANNQTISYRSGQTVDLLAGNYRVGITNSGASVEYTFNSTANTIYSVNNNDDTWNNVANNSQIVMTANESARSGEANDWVGFGDLTDYYKLVLDKAGTYTLAIDGLDNNAVMTLYLVNAAGTAVSTQSGWSTTAQRS